MVWWARGNAPLAVCVLNVKPHNVGGDPCLVKLVAHFLDVGLIVVVPSALVTQW